MDPTNDKTISELKYQINNWLLDELGLDADEYIILIDDSKTLKDLNTTVLSIYSSMRKSNPTESRALYTFWHTLYT